MMRADPSASFLIGITGHVGRGKSTLARMLVDVLGEPIVIAALADPLKTQVHALVETVLGSPLSPEQHERLKGRILGPLYQGWGELKREAEGPDYWLDLLLQRIINEPRVIVPDVRFVHEARGLKARNAVLVGIRGYCFREGETRSLDHASEVEVPAVLDLCDVIVENWGSRRKLEYAAGAIVQQLGFIPPITPIEFTGGV